MNYMKQIANILGVEMGETFEITTAGATKSDGCFELTENGIKRWTFPSYNKNIAREDDDMLARLLIKVAARNPGVLTTWMNCRLPR